MYLKQLLLVYQEHHSLLEDDKITDKAWFEEVDEYMRKFRHKIQK